MELDEITAANIIQAQFLIQEKAIPQFMEGAITEEELKNFILQRIYSVVESLLERQGNGRRA